MTTTTPARRLRPARPPVRATLGGLVALLLSLLLMGTTAGVAGAAPAITVEATPGGTHVKFDAASAAPATWTVMVSLTPPLATTPPRFPDSAEGITVSSPVAQRFFSPIVTALGPGRTYYYIVKATNATGTSYATGSVKTLRRHLTVKFTKIDVIDDSDDTIFDGLGDLTFHFRLNGTWHPEHDYGEVYVGSGESTFPNRTQVYQVGPHGYSPNFLTLDVEGMDKDCGTITDLCTSGMRPSFEGGGSSDDLDWATASSGPIFVGRTGGPEVENFTGQTSFKTTAHQLKFRVHVTYTVTYIP